MDFEKAEAYVRQLLRNGLSPLLTYHNFNHTMEVLEAAVGLAAAEKVTNEEDLILLKTAALFHDCGYVHVYQNHEAESCHIARQVLPGFGYSPEQVNRICDMIMKTSMAEPPSNRLEQILCDADLDYLGSDEFEQRGSRLFDEWKAYGVVNDPADWNQRQIRFLEKHRYYTRSANARSAPKKAEHLRKLRNGTA